MKISSMNSAACIIVFLALLLIVDAQVRVDWVLRYDSPGGENPAKAVDIDDAGHPLVVFETNGNGTLYDDKNAKLTEDHQWNGAVVMKMSPNSSGLIWRTRIDCDSGERIAAVAHNDENDVYVAGACNSDLALYHSDDTKFMNFTKTSSSFSWIVKYDKNGIVLWAARINGTDEVVAKGASP
jgi:hypothetical protein